MKKLDQASKEYACSIAPVIVAGTEVTQPVEFWNQAIQKDFKSGAQFARSWIKVEDELPPQGAEVEFKLTRGLLRNGKYTKGTFWEADGILIERYPDKFSSYVVRVLSEIECWRLANLT